MLCKGAVLVLLYCGRSLQGLEALGRAMGCLAVDLFQAGGRAGCFSQAAVSHEVVLWDRGCHRVIATGLHGAERNATCGFGSGGAPSGQHRLQLRLLSIGKSGQRESIRQIPLNSMEMICAEPTYTQVNVAVRRNVLLMGKEHALRVRKTQECILCGKSSTIFNIHFYPGNNTCM